MIWISLIIIILLVLSIWQFLLIRMHKISIEGFELLLTKFIEVNQQFYDSQKNIGKKEKEIFDSLVKQTSEFSILRRYSNQLNISINNINDVSKSLKDNQKEIKTTSDELNVSKDIANSLAVVSNNIKLLDKIVISLNQSIELLKRRGKNAN